MQSHIYHPPYPTTRLHAIHSMLVMIGVLRVMKERRLVGTLEFKQTSHEPIPVRHLPSFVISFDASFRNNPNNRPTTLLHDMRIMLMLLQSLQRWLKVTNDVCVQQHEKLGGNTSFRWPWRGKILGATRCVANENFVRLMMIEEAED
jgi:hypothetical protein